MVEFESSRSRRRHGNAVSLLAFPVRWAAAGLARARASGDLWLYEHRRRRRARRRGRKY